PAAHRHVPGHRPGRRRGPHGLHRPPRRAPRRLAGAVGCTSDGASLRAKEPSGTVFGHWCMVTRQEGVAQGRGAPVTVDEVLALAVDELAPLQHPVLLIGLTGWFDVAGAATAALAELTDGAITVGEIDADPFYDFTQERPTVELVDGETRRVSWPANDFK